MKKTLLVLYGAFLPFILCAQKEGRDFIDSVSEQLGGGQALVNAFEKKLATSKKDTNQIMLLDALSFYYSNINPDTGIKYGLRALDLSRELNYKKRLSNIYGNIGADYLQKSEFPKGLEYLFLSLKIEEERGNKSRIQLRLYNISSAYFNISEYDKALEYYDKGKLLKVAVKFDDVGFLRKDGKIRCWGLTPVAEVKD